MNRKTVGIVAGVVVAIAVVAAVSLYLSQPSIREIKLEAWEFGFNGPKGGPTIKIRAGETVKIIFMNKGAIEHEFMVVRDKDSFLSALHEKINELKAQGLDEEEIGQSHEIHMVHEKMQ